ncbi:hypothetical protein FNV43_RR27240 [Rhamnella rubrinervis]|uniref:Uncharacterized protein n=1 Tax=Rhamnella rubrinervis TaxID=2594499 RepID=A0A8K0DK72_9ROSA|nr:hypothetical protein FNV43_RR27240 [Rhamnella rubrinervis]
MNEFANRVLEDDNYEGPVEEDDDDYNDIEIVWRRQEHNYDDLQAEHQEKVIAFYHVLSDVIELSYMGGNLAIIFKCDWWDLGTKRRINIDEFGYEDIKAYQEEECSTHNNNLFIENEQFSLLNRVDNENILMDIEAKGFEVEGFDLHTNVDNEMTSFHTVTMSKWINVEKISDMATKRKEMLACATGWATQVIPTRSSPRKPMRHQGALIENRKAQKNRGLMPTRCSLRNHDQLKKKMIENETDIVIPTLKLNHVMGYCSLLILVHKSYGKVVVNPQGVTSTLSSLGHDLLEEGDMIEPTIPGSTNIVNSTGSGQGIEQSMANKSRTNDGNQLVTIGPKTIEKKRKITTGKLLTKWKKQQIKVPGEFHQELRQQVELHY